MVFFFVFLYSWGLIKHKTVKLKGLEEYQNIFMNSSASKLSIFGVGFVHRFITINQNERWVCEHLHRLWRELKPVSSALWSFWRRLRRLWGKLQRNWRCESFHAYINEVDKRVREWSVKWFIKKVLKFLQGLFTQPKCLSKHFWDKSS